jgi:hypothetical protein
MTCPGPSASIGLASPFPEVPGAEFLDGASRATHHAPGVRNDVSNPFRSVFAFETTRTISPPCVGVANREWGARRCGTEAGQTNSSKSARAVEVTALMGAVENQRQVYPRSHRPWKSLRDSHTPTARRLLINNEVRKRAEVSPINGARRVSVQGCSPCRHRVFYRVFCLSPGFYQGISKNHPTSKIGSGGPSASFGLTTCA